MDPQNIDTVIRLLIGSVVLFAGRNVFWLFVALGGFLVGIEAASIWFTNQSAWSAAFVALGLGALGAVVAILFRRVAFTVAGFFAGAFVAIAVHQHFGLTTISPIVIFLAGLAGAVFAALIMDTAIVVLSALVGAAAIVTALDLTTSWSAIMFAVLVALGLSIQMRVLSRHAER